MNFAKCNDKEPNEDANVGSRQKLNELQTEDTYLNRFFSISFQIM